MAVRAPSRTHLATRLTGPPLPLPLPESSGKLDATMWRLCKEFLSFLKQEKKWWLIPLVLVLLMLAGLILFSGSAVLAPFMYPFM
jgi:hypothetical protein